MAGVEPTDIYFDKFTQPNKVTTPRTALTAKAMENQTGGNHAVKPPNAVKSGAAGAATFPGSDSRKYNYYEPKGRKATHYEDMTVDVQPDPERYLLQDWIISFRRRHADLHARAGPSCKSQQLARVPRRRSGMGADALSAPVDHLRHGARASSRMAAAPARRPASIRAWVKVLQDHLGAYKHAEFGLGTSIMQAQRYGYTQMINNAILTNSSYKLRFAQDLTLYLSEIGMDLHRCSTPTAGKTHWLEDPIWQGTREAIEEIMGADDYLEQYFAINVVFEPLVGELFRSGFIMQMAAAQNDFITPSVVSAAEADYERNLANTVELFHMLAARSRAWRRTISTVLQRLAGQARRAGARGRQPAAADLVAAARQGRHLHRRPRRGQEPGQGDRRGNRHLKVPARSAPDRVIGRTVQPRMRKQSHERQHMTTSSSR